MRRTHEVIMTASRAKNDASGEVSTSSTPRPGLGIVLNGFTPYNLHHCQRIAREIPEFELHCVFTFLDEQWNVDVPPEIHLAHFGNRNSRTRRNWDGWRLEDVRTGRQVFEHFRRHRVKAVVHAGYSSLLHLRVISLLHRAGVPIFFRSDSNIFGDRDRGRLRAWLKRRLVRWVLRRCDGVMPMGEYGIQYFEKYGADRNHCFLVPHEPEYGLFEAVDATELLAFRRRHGLRDDRRYLLSCCRLVPVKRVDLLIDAFKSIADRRPDWDLLLVGEGPLRKELEARVPAHLSTRVHWLGFCQVDQVRLAFHASDVFVLPSDYEPWAVVINEAAAARLVTVASSVVGAAHELVRDRVNGRIFQAGRLGELTGALLEVTDPESYAQYRQQVGPVLDAWRKTGDPVEGVRSALRSVGLLPDDGCRIR